jgi:hypothetical protein
MRSAGCREGNCHWLFVCFASLWINIKVLPCVRGGKIGSAEKSDPTGFETAMPQIRLAVGSPRVMMGGGPRSSV